MVWADKQPFIVTSNYVEASYYDQEFGPIKFKGKKKDGAPREIYMESRDIFSKLLKTTIIVHFRPIKRLIIEEFNG